MKYLSRGKLTTILKWGNFCNKSDNYLWSKSDANLFLDVIRERDDMIHEHYLEYKNKKKIC